VPLALHLLFHLPLLVGGVITGMVSLLLLRIQDQTRPAAVRNASSPAYCCSLRSASPPVFSWRHLHRRDVIGGLVPQFRGKESVLLAAGHPGRDRHAACGVSAFRTGSRPATVILIPAHTGVGCCVSPGSIVGLAMVVAGGVNAAMLLVAALNMKGRGGIGSIEAAYTAVHDTVSPMIAVFFRDRIAGFRVGVGIGGRICRRDDHAGVAIPVDSDVGAATGDRWRPALLILTLDF